MPMPKGAKVTPPFYRSTAVKSGLVHALRRGVVEAERAKVAGTGAAVDIAVSSQRVKAACGAVVPCEAKQRYQVKLDDRCEKCEGIVLAERAKVSSERAGRVKAKETARVARVAKVAKGKLAKGKTAKGKAA